MVRPRMFSSAALRGITTRYTSHTQHSQHEVTVSFPIEGIFQKSFYFKLPHTHSITPATWHNINPSGYRAVAPTQTQARFAVLCAFLLKKPVRRTVDTRTGKARALRARAFALGKCWVAPRSEGKGESCRRDREMQDLGLRLHHKEPPICAIQLQDGRGCSLQQPARVPNTAGVPPRHCEHASAPNVRLGRLQPP